MSKCKIVTMADFGEILASSDLGLTEKRKAIIQHIYDTYNVINVIDYRGDVFFVTEEESKLAKRK